MERMLRIGYVTAMWGRPELTSRVFAWTADLREKLAPLVSLDLACAGSEGKASAKIASEHGFAYVEVPNSPLGAKWNAAPGLLAERGLDGVCIFGSDDIASIGYFQALRSAALSGVKLAGVGGMYFFDLDYGRILHWLGYSGGERDKDTPGAGRFIHSDIIARTGWKLWPDHYNRGLDNGMLRILKEALGQPPEFTRLENAVVMDIKGAGGMNSFESMASIGEAWLLGNPRQFMIRNFGEEMADSFCGQASAEDADCLVYSPWTGTLKTRKATSPPDVIYIQDDDISPGAQDFLWGCLGSGLSAVSALAEDYLEADIHRDYPVFIDPEGASLLASLASQGLRVLDEREIPNARIRELAERLGLPRLTSGEQSKMTLPLPFSQLPATPSFNQRGQIALCLVHGGEKLDFTRYWLASAREPAERLFIVDCPASLGQYEGAIMNIYHSQVFATRALFRVIIYNAAAYGFLASHFMACHTPAVCMGKPPESGPGQKGQIIVTDASEAIAAALLLAKREDLWRQKSLEMATFTKTRHKAFMRAARRLLAPNEPCHLSRID